MKVEPGVFCSQAITVGVLVGRVVVQNQVDLQAGGDLGVDDLEELEELAMAVSGQTLPMTVPVNTSSAANSVVVPFRL